MGSSRKKHLRRPVRRRRWTEREDAILHNLALHNAHNGLTDGDGMYQARLKNAAKLFGRTYAAVRIRASRIRAISYEARAQINIEDATNETK